MARPAMMKGEQSYNLTLHRRYIKLGRINSTTPTKGYHDDHYISFRCVTNPKSRSANPYAQSRRGPAYNFRRLISDELRLD
jgi:hypothetical protein